MYNCCVLYNQTNKLNLRYIMHPHLIKKKKILVVEITNEDPAHGHNYVEYSEGW